MTRETPDERLRMYARYRRLKDRSGFERELMAIAKAFRDQRDRCTKRAAKLITALESAK